MCVLQKRFRANECSDTVYTELRRLAEACSYSLLERVSTG